MIDSGDVHLADLGREIRHVVLVVSNRRFHRLSGRALVCPRTELTVDEPFPWWVGTDTATFAVDRLASLPLDRLLDRVDRVRAAELAQVRRAVLAIT